MSSFSRNPLAVLLGLLALPLLAGCAAEDADERAAYPGAPPGMSADPTHQAATSELSSVSGEETANEPQGQPSGDPSAVPGADGSETPIGVNNDEYADTDPSALTDFHSTLDPHGQWVDDPTYGTMWQPSASEVGSDFAPYVSGGHWAYDDSDDYVWMSDYGWGWAPFHYGRWAYGGAGWGWIPGREYAPAWVTWRTGYPGFGYVGWAPLPPTWYWGPGGVALGLGFVPRAPYAFCGVHDVFAPGLSGRIVTAPGSIRTIAGQTHPYAPAAGGRIAAHPQIAGPTPQSLRIGNNEVAHVPSTNPQLAHAQQFAHPSTATAMGAHGPAGLAGHSAGAIVSGRGNYPGGAVAGHAQMSRPSMSAYGGSAHSYYNSGGSRSLGSSYYGRGGGVSNSYASPSYHHGGGGYHAPSYGGGSHYSGGYGGSMGGGGHSYGGGGRGGGHGGGGHR
jgi:hypothetical protein